MEVAVVSSVLNAVLMDGRNQTDGFRDVLRIVTRIGVPVSTAGMVTRETRLKNISSIG